MDLPKAVGVMSANLSPPSRRIGSQEPIYLQDDILHLQSDTQRLRDTLSRMYNLINGAEWRSHERCVAELLPKLRDTVYDAEDLLDEFRWHKINVELEGNAGKPPFMEFFDTVIQGNFNKLKDVQGRLDRLSSQMEKMGINEMKHVMGLLGVNSKRKRATSRVKTSTSMSPRNQVDDFDVKRLIKEVICSTPGKKETSDTLDSLQRTLSNKVKNKRLLIVLDDIWDDDLKENLQCWKKFCAPLKSAQEGSMMLITTRCPKVVQELHTMEPVILEGLNDDIFWNFFKFCVFGSESSSNDPELKCIGRKILPKLKGSPLAAKTLGRMLRIDLKASHWNSILENELWELRQEPTDILPALRLSYMYLPFYLKGCFSFCAVYPKDYKFQKEDLAEVWVAEGFVEAQDDDSIQKTSYDDSIQKTSYQYFQELVTRSFFQKASGGYVIHDLLHDMAQKVSEHECFILRNKSDFDKVPLNIRHIYVHSSNDFDNSKFLSLCKHTKLRTLICKKQYIDAKSALMDNWCSKLLRLRVMTCTSTNELPDSIGNLKHLRYLKISKGRPLSIPPSFSSLYNLQILDVRSCKIGSLPDDFSNLRKLKKFVAPGLLYNPVSTCNIDAAEQVQGFRIMKNLNQFHGDLKITNVQMLSKDDAAEAKLKNKKTLNMLALKWSDLDYSQIMDYNAVEVLQVLQPPTSLRSFLLKNYPGVNFPFWFQPQMTNLNSIPPVIDASNDILVFLTDVDISGCENLLSLEHFLHPYYIPAVKKISLRFCKSLVSVPTERFGDFNFLEELRVSYCPNIRSQRMVSPSLKQLYLMDCGSLLDNIDCCSLTKFTISSARNVEFQPQVWTLPALQELHISHCSYLTSIGDSPILPLCAGTDNVRAFSKLNALYISNCNKLSIVDGLLTPEYLPAIERIDVSRCPELLSLSGERLGVLSSLKHLHVHYCKSLSWQSGLVLPSSLQTLELDECGDFSACIPGCLENLTSLVSLKIIECQGLTFIPGYIWHSKLALLEELVIEYCQNLESIGGAKAVAKIKKVEITRCPKLKEAQQIRRGRSADGTQIRS